MFPLKIVNELPMMYWIIVVKLRKLNNWIGVTLQDKMKTVKIIDVCYMKIIIKIQLSIRTFQCCRFTSNAVKKRHFILETGTCCCLQWCAASIDMTTNECHYYQNKIWKMDFLFFFFSEMNKYMCLSYEWDTVKC